MLVAKKETATPVQESAAERAKREREWDKLVEALPELVHPLDLPDDVQVELLQSANEIRGFTERDDDAEAGLELVKTVARLMPRLFVSKDEFEAWRRSLPVLRRADTFMTIYAKYVAELGEVESSSHS